VIAIEYCSACGYPKFGRRVCFACRGAVAMSDQRTEPNPALTEPETEPIGSSRRQRPRASIRIVGSGPTWS
jgi:hypothetical protein